MASRGTKQPIPFLLFGLLLVLSAPIPGRTLVWVPATDTPLTFEPPPNGVVVAAGATLNTRLEPIEAQTPRREESNRIRASESTRRATHCGSPTKFPE